MLEHSLIYFLEEYGVAALFILLALGIVALPIPDESLLVIAGYFVAKGNLSELPTILSAIGGTWCGISISYYLGRTLGPYFIKKLGRYVGLNSNRVKKATDWFLRTGRWSLVVGYFIPGVRHLVGYIAGTLGLPYKQFALFSYSGGLVWTQLFLAIGYFFHKEWHTCMQFLYAFFNN